MPNRMLSGEVARSESLSRVSMEAELTFLHLVSVADDYGRFDGRPTVLLASLFPTRIEQVSHEALARWLSELEGEGLIRWYEVDGRRYLELPGWPKHQRLRSSKPKYPEPVKTRQQARRVKAASRSSSPRVAADRGSRARASESEDVAGDEAVAGDVSAAAGAAGPTPSAADDPREGFEPEKLVNLLGAENRERALPWLHEQLPHIVAAARAQLAAKKVSRPSRDQLTPVVRERLFAFWKQQGSGAVPLARAGPLKRFDAPPSVEQIKEAFHRQGGAR